MVYYFNKNAAKDINSQTSASPQETHNIKGYYREKLDDTDGTDSKMDKELARGAHNESLGNANNPIGGGMDREMTDGMVNQMASGMHKKVTEDIDRQNMSSINRVKPFGMITEMSGNVDRKNKVKILGGIHPQMSDTQDNGMSGVSYHEKEEDQENMRNLSEDRRNLTMMDNKNNTAETT